MVMTLDAGLHRSLFGNIVFSILLCQQHFASLGINSVPRVNLAKKVWFEKLPNLETDRQLSCVTAFGEFDIGRRGLLEKALEKILFWNFVVIQSTFSFSIHIVSCFNDQMLFTTLVLFLH